jgi:hypothetical protein
MISVHDHEKNVFMIKYRECSSIDPEMNCLVVLAVFVLFEHALCLF